MRSLFREYDNVDKWVLLFDTPSYNKALLRTKYFKRYNELRLRQSKAIRQCEKELEDANAERVNIPANPKHYWRYRMHLNIEDLLECEGFMKNIQDLIEQTER